MSKHNHLAILVAVVLQFVLGFIWYSPMLFLTPWATALGKTAQSMNEPNPSAFAITLVCAILAAYAMSWLVNVTRTDTLAKGAMLGLVVGFGFAIPALLPHYAFAGVSGTVMNIDALNVLVAAIINGSVLGAWRKKDTLESVMSAG